MLKISRSFSFENGMIIVVIVPQLSWGIYKLNGFMTDHSIKMLHWGKFINSFEIFSLRTQPLHYNCTVITGLLKHRITAMSYLWRLTLNIMISIFACTAIHGSAISQTHAWSTWSWQLPAAQNWWLPRRSGGGSIVALSGAATQAAQQWDINTRYGRPSFVQSTVAAHLKPQMVQDLVPECKLGWQCRNPPGCPGSRSDQISNWMSNCPVG